MLLPVLALLTVQPDDARNEVSAALTFPLPRWGAALSYRRALARRVSVTAALHTVVPTRGFLHLPGVEERLALGVWLRRVGRGPYVAPTVGFGHNVFHKVPSLARHTLRVGAGAGWHLPLTSRLSVGAGLGGYWGARIGKRGSVCTYDYQCASSRPGGVLEARVSMGVRW